MGLYPDAEWIGPTPNKTVNGMVRPFLGVVLHIQQGSEQGSESWLKNPQSQASAHLLNPKVGKMRQLVDFDDKAWAEAGGNPKWISVENEGVSGDSLTESQMRNVADLMVFLGQTEKIPLIITDSPDRPGLGWHGMGGQDWGGHLDCPGEPIKNQRQQILALATPSKGDFTVDQADRVIAAINQLGAVLEGAYKPDGTIADGSHISLRSLKLELDAIRQMIAGKQ